MTTTRVRWRLGMGLLYFYSGDASKGIFKETAVLLPLTLISKTIIYKIGILKWALVCAKGLGWVPNLVLFSITTT